MNLITYIQIDTIPILTLIMLYINSKYRFSVIPNAKRFRFLILLVIGILLIDITTWYMLVKGKYVTTPLFQLLNIAYYCLTEVISYCWFLYVCHRVYGESLSHKHRMMSFVFLISLMVICLIITSSPLTHAVFYVDKTTKEFHRGYLIYLYVIFGFAYLISASVIAFTAGRNTSRIKKRQDNFFLSYVVLLPLIGGLIQILDFDLLFLWPFTAAGFFLIYVNFQRSQISMDALTALNNRGSFDQHILHKFQSSEDSWYLVIADVDKFKSINDKYGHVEGDNALKSVAKALVKAFGTTSFISRYGGDEFAVIVDSTTDGRIDTMLNTLHTELNNSNKRNNRQYPLTISTGYARCDKNELYTIKELTDLVDQKMYDNKKKS